MRGWLQYMLSSTFACPTSEDGLVLVAVRAFNQYVAFMENEAEDEDGLCEECDCFCVLRMLRQCFVTTAHRPAVTQFVCTSTASKNPIVQSACVSMTQEGREDVIEKIRP